jgi:hypothetical protein
MAADTGLTYGYSCFAGAGSKLFMVGGSMFGLCGNASDCAAFRLWQEASADKPAKFDEQVSILEVRGDGTIWIWDKTLVPYQVRAPFFAVGSGSELALGAMAVGASAERALEIACEYDNGTKGPVETLRFESAITIAAE